MRGKLLFTPEVLPGLRIVATYVHDRHTRGTYWTELDPPYSSSDRVATEDVADRTRVRSDIGTLEADYDLARGLSLSSITNYSRIVSLGLFDPDRSPTPGAVTTIRDPSKTFQQELRLNIDRSWVKGLIGAYYLRDDNRGYLFDANEQLGLRRLGVDQVLMGDPFNLPQAVTDAVLDLYGGNVSIVNQLLQPRLTRNAAGFADLTFPITSRLRLIAGLRYDHESQLRGATETTTLTKPLPDPATVPAALAPIVTALNGFINNLAAGANSDNPLRTVTYHAWLPKAGVTYDLARDVSLSFTAQRGYRAGGAGINQQRAQYYTYDPEYTWNYELALRSELFDHRLTVNANAFYIDWRDQQVSVELTPGATFDEQTVNAGKSRLYGGELSISGRPTRTLDLFAGVGYTNTRIARFDNVIGSPLGAAEGNQFANAPHWTASGAVTWRHPTGIFVNVNAQYRSAFYQDTVVQTTPDIRPLTLVNARVGWQGRHVGAFVIASNLLNVEKPIQSFADFDGRTRGVVSPPRTIGLDFEAKF